MGNLFGTDGIRGIANEKITAETALNLGKAFAINLSKNACFRRVIVGCDTRVSGQMLVSAFVAGLNSQGFSAVLPNILPTPALSYLTRSLDVDGGVMITASHNAPEFNGIKFYDKDGNKLEKAEQDEIEKIYFEIDSYLGCEPMEIGNNEENEDLTKLWVDHLIDTLKMPSLNGVKIALDCANGAAYAVAPYVFKSLGAVVTSYNNFDDGSQINVDCGSTHIDGFISACVSNGVDWGFSFDGDADRVLAVTSAGELIDGTDMLYIFAKYLKEKGALPHDTVVSTIITNCGLEHSLAKLGINVVSTQVGGLFIQREMLAHGYVLGGEENGHIMYDSISPESCGITAALLLLKIVSECGNVEKLLAGLERTKVVNADIPVSERQKVKVASGALDDYVNEFENALGSKGRIVVRPSGTESVVRVLVEGDDLKLLNNICKKLVDKVDSI